MEGGCAAASCSAWYLVFRPSARGRYTASLNLERSIARVAFSCKSTALQKALNMFSKAIRTQIMVRLSCIYIWFWRVNDGSRIWLTKLILCSVFLPVSVTLDLTRNFLCIIHDFMYLRLRVQHEGLGCDEAAQEFTQSRFRFIVGSRIWSYRFGEAKQFFNRSNSHGDIGNVRKVHNGVEVKQNVQAQPPPSESNLTNTQKP